MDFKASRRLHIANMTMAIIEAAVASVAGTLSAVTVSMELTLLPLTVLHAAVCIILFAAVITAIWHAVSCRAGVCHCNNLDGDQQRIISGPQENDAYVPFEQLPRSGQLVVPRTIMIQSPSQLYPNIPVMSTAVPLQTLSPPSYDG